MGSKESTKCEEEVNTEGQKSESVSQVSEGMNQELQNLDITQNSFKDRITEWINTVTIKDATINTDTDQVENAPSTFTASTPKRNSSFSVAESGEDDENEDDQPSALTSPARVLMVSNFTNVTDTDEDQDAIEELKRRFQAERSSFVASSIIPSTALRSFEEGFANVQMSNGNELFDNGICSNRHQPYHQQFSDIPRWQEKMNKNYHFKVSETTEQKMLIKSDGTREVDTVHKREQTENLYDDGLFNKLGFCFKVLLVVLFLIGLAGIVVYLVRDKFDFTCLTTQKDSTI